MQNTFIIISTILFVIIIFLLIVIFRRINKLQESKVLGELESEVNDLVLELNQTADRNINILEEKIKTLVKILNNADKRIKILGMESGKSKSETVTYNQLGIIQDNQILNRKIEKNQPKIIKEEVVEEKLKEKNKKDIIIELHNNGFTSVVIASRVGLTIGEVELIISLVEGRQNYGSQ